MTEHYSDVSISPKSISLNTSNSSDSCFRSPTDSNSTSSSFRSRSPSPFGVYEDEDCVNLLTNKQFHVEISALANSENSEESILVDAKNRIVSVGNNELLTDHEFLMNIALRASLRSDDPKTKVGACIVDRKQRIIGIGYNHFPPNYTDEPYPWCKDKGNKLNNKLTYVIHAESDAIFSTQSPALRGATIYSTLMPCNECAKLIIQSGIRTVYYRDEKNLEKWIYKASRRMFHAARVTLQQLECSAQV
ncbi:deoxycytidylate deaminase [Zeugodacus cucurbitae]|uniref:deoxycytidylate deaminase n=1 Tax=Zeugodacus cucurbitae TaxID=28588 RepID=UPI0005967FEC|nr:deoxycytidylate deaminase [Zeugodacus cucurbitae]